MLTGSASGLATVDDGLLTVAKSLDDTTLRALTNSDAWKQVVANGMQVGPELEDSLRQAADAAGLTQDQIDALIAALGTAVPQAAQQAESAATDAATQMSDDIGQAADQTGDLVKATRQISDAVKRAAEEGTNYYHKMIEDIQAVQDEVDAVSFGHSPGGLKEIPIMLRAASHATQAWRSDTLDELARVQRVVDNMGWTGAPGAPGSEFVGSGARAGDTFQINGDIHASAIDTDGLRDLVEDPDGIGMLMLQALRTNRRGMGTAARNILGLD